MAYVAREIQRAQMVRTSTRPIFQLSLTAHAHTAKNVLSRNEVESAALFAFPTTATVDLIIRRANGETITVDLEPVFIYALAEWLQDHGRESAEWHRDNLSDPQR